MGLCITIFLQLDKLPLDNLDRHVRSLLEGIGDGVHCMVPAMHDYTCRPNVKTKENSNLASGSLTVQVQLYAKTLLGTVHYLTVGRHPSAGMILGINDYGDNSFWLGDGLITAAPVAPAFSLDEDNVGAPVAQHLIPEDLCSDHGEFLSESDTVVTLGEPEPLSEDTLYYLFVCPPDPPKIRRGSLRKGICI
jgi:hypothetical protein